MARLTLEQRRSLELLAGNLHGLTENQLVIAHGFGTKMLAGLVHEGLATAAIGEPVNASGKMAQVVRIMITDAGRAALERPNFWLSPAPGQ